MEIGTAAGGTLKELIGAYPDADARPPFYVIDPLTFFPDQLTKVKQNLSSADIDPETVTFWVGTTQSELPRVRATGMRFDFVFIDGDHRHYPVMVDLQWADLVTVGGTICLHDTSAKFPGVGWSIDHFLSRNPEFAHLGQTDTLTILRKKAEADGPTVTPQDLRKARRTQLRSKWSRSLRKRIGRRPTAT